MPTNRPPLQNWQNLLQSNTTDLMVTLAWRQVTPVGVLRELAILAEEDIRALEGLWHTVCGEDTSLFLRHYYTHEAGYHGQRIAHERIHAALKGMVSGALAVQSARRYDYAGLRKWVQESCKAWEATGSGDAWEESIRPDDVLGEPKASLSEDAAAALKTEFTHLWEQDRNTWRVAAARNWANACMAEITSGRTNLSVNLDRRVVRAGRMPLLASQEGRLGTVQWLYVELLSDGSGELYPDPCRLGLAPMTLDFLQAIDTAWSVTRQYLVSLDLEATRNIGREDIRWWITGDSIVLLGGGSHGAAMTATLIRMLCGGSPIPGSAISAIVLPDGRIGPVQDIRHKVGAALSARDIEGSPLIRRLTLHPGNYTEAQIAADGCALKLATAETIEDYLQQEVGCLSPLLEKEIGWILRKAEWRIQRRIPDWNTLSSIYVPIRIQRSQPPDSRIHSSKGDDSAEAAPKGISGIDLSFTDWEKVCKTSSRIAVLGDPGCGKSLLMLHAVGCQCNDALCIIRERRGGLQTPPFAVYVSASELEAFIDRNAQTSPLTLIEVLTKLLVVRHSLEPEIAEILQAKIQTGDCLIVLDALDEMSNKTRRGIEDTIRDLERRHPESRLLLSSRREGYDRKCLGLTVENELFILDFDDRQMQMAIYAWFSPHRHRGEEIWKRIYTDRHLRNVLRSPLRLYLACREAEVAWSAGQSILRWEQRGLLYKVFLDHAAAQWALRHPHPSMAQHDLFLAFAADVSLQLMRHQNWDAENAEHTRTTATMEKVADVVNIVMNNYPIMNDRHPLDDLCAAGVITKVEGVGNPTSYRFTHPSYGEYLAAYGLARQANEEGWSSIAEEMESYSHQTEWHNVIIFLAGCLQDPLPLLEMLLRDDDELRHRTALAARCLHEILPD